MHNVYIIKWLLTLVLLITTVWACSGSGDTTRAQVADIVGINAVIHTMDDRQPLATAFAIAGGKFIYVGNKKEAVLFAGLGTQRIDFAGKAVLPGFNDAHMHPMMIEPGAIYIGPDAAKTVEDIVARLREQALATKPGEWITGWGYDHTKLGRHPSKSDLDTVSQKHPIILQHVSGHIATANSLAYQGAGISTKTPDPDGGAFDRTDDGGIQGVCRERVACDQLYSAHFPRTERTADNVFNSLNDIYESFYSFGITSISDAFVTPKLMMAYEVAAKRGAAMRVNLMTSDEHIGFARFISIAEKFGLRKLLGSSRIKTGTVKVFHGNSFSGHTCWLNDAYANRHDYFGVPPARNQEQLNEHILSIHRAGLQLAIHSNGDREISMVLDAIEHALQKYPTTNHRHRIEHASLVNAEILQRVKELGVVLALHSYVYEHGDKIEAYGPKRYDWAHANKSAMEAGIVVAGNSDFPVSAARVMTRVKSLSTRRSIQGKVYGSSQRITARQALQSYTSGSAYASFEEDIKGSIANGHYADYVVLSEDPMLLDGNEIGDVEVLSTVINGKTVYGSFAW